MYTILKIGTLKYDRLKSMSILRKELNYFSNDYSYKDIKEIFDSILKNEFNEIIDESLRICLNHIFDGNEYKDVEFHQTETNFPENWIPPIG
jgi:hypothetical protein